MGRKPRDKELTKKLLLEALEDKLGIITEACRVVGCNRQTYYNYYNEDEDFKKAADDIQNIVIDFVEYRLFDRMKEGDTTSIIFYLKTKAKKRGYVEGYDINHNIQKIKFDFGDE